MLYFIDNNNTKQKTCILYTYRCLLLTFYGFLSIPSIVVFPSDALLYFVCNNAVYMERYMHQM